MDSVALTRTSAGLLLIALSIPLARGQVARNRFYGVRFRQSLQSDEAWYAINRYGGKRLIAWSAPLVLLGIASLLLPLKNHPNLALLCGFLQLIFVLIPTWESWRFARKYGSGLWQRANAPMVILKPITLNSVAAFKAVRLRALQDAPLAFGSTYARELQLSNAEWEQRTIKWNSERSAGYLAWDGEDVCGIAASFLDLNEPTKAHLISMWVAPSHRGQGVGRLLVTAIIDWARSKRANVMRLTVTSANDRAIGFYEHLGFTMTGRTEPYPNDSSLVEFEMIRRM